MRHTEAMSLLAGGQMSLLRVNGRTEIFGRNSAVKLAIRLDRRERAKTRLARIKHNRPKWYQFVKLTSQEAR